MHALDKTLREQAVILTHRIMVIDALRLAQTARDYLEAGCDVMPDTLLDRHEEDTAKRRQRIKVLTRA
jgi:hypothetical protein